MPKFAPDHTPVPIKKSPSASGLRWLWLTLLVIVVDLLGKRWIMTHFSLYETLPLIPFFNLHYTHNPGAAFSFLAGADGWQRWFFSVIAIVIVLMLLVLMYRTHVSQKISNMAYALIVGGAAGNLIDRLCHGFVIDMIDFYIANWHFPTFNIADSAICIGAVLIILESFLPASQSAKAKDK